MSRRNVVRDPGVVCELDGAVGSADHELHEAIGCTTETLDGAIEQGRAGDRGQRSALGWFPDHWISADESECSVPAPDGDGKVEGADHGDRSEGVPGLGQPVAGTL